MKKLLFGSVTVLLISCAMPSQGQITITLADFASIGDTVTNVYDSIVPVGTTVGGTGNQTWDYSTLQLDYIDTTIYVDPATTASVADFPASTIATDNNGFASYLKADSAGVVFEGISTDFFGTGTPVSLVYSPSQTVIEFPSTDGSGFTDTSAFNFQFSGATVGGQVDSVGINHRSFLTSTIDAYGSVTTPSGTYASIRQYTIELTYDSILIKDSLLTGGLWIFLDPALLPGIANPAIDTVYNYHWYANGEDYPVLEMQTDGPAGNVLGANFKLGNQVIAAIIGTNDITCVGDCDGSVDVTAISGTPPFTYLWDDPANQTTAMAIMLCPGTYTVTVTDAVGGTSTAVATVVEPDTLTVSLFGVGPACDSCADGWVSAAVLGGTAPYTYAWDDPASQSGSSAISLMNGTYSVTVTDANGCTIISDSLQVMGIELLEEMDILSIYPNPTSGTIYIDSYSKGLKVDVLDMMGRLVLQVDTENTGAIDISGLPDGTYYVQIWKEGLLGTKKVVLIR